MRTTAGLATLCLLATMSLAGQQPGGDSPRRRQKMAFPATLTAHFRTTADQLQVEYVVTNAGREPLYVINVSIRVTSQGATVEPATPRAALASTGELVLASAIPPLDPSISYAVPPRFYASRLDAGASLKQSFALPLPVAPSGLPPKREPREVVVDRVAFVLGVIPASAVPNAQRQEIGGVEVWRLPPGAHQHQVELRVEARVANLRVLTE
jgi:hypothetical protein